MCFSNTKKYMTNLLTGLENIFTLSRTNFLQTSATKGTITFTINSLQTSIVVHIALTTPVAKM